MLLLADGTLITANYSCGVPAINAGSVWSDGLPTTNKIPIP